MLFGLLRVLARSLQNRLGNRQLGRRIALQTVEKPRNRLDGDRNEKYISQKY